MKKLLFLIIVFLPQISFGEMIVYSSDTLKTIYVDPSTIKRDGNLVDFWMLHSYNSALDYENGKKYQSTIGRNVYDCKNEIQRTLFFTIYQGSKGSGEVLGIVNYLNDKPNWSPIMPNSPNMIVYKKICNTNSR
jgi:hypothetical protein